MYFVDLVELVVTGEQRKQRKNLEENAADSPDVHLVAVVTIGHQALGRTIPARRDILGKRRLTVQTPAATKVSQFDRIARQKNVLRFDVSVENSVTVHVFDGLQQLVDVKLDARLWQVSRSSFNRFV